MADEALGVQAAAAITELLAGMTGPRFFGTTYPNAPTAERDFKTVLAVQRFPHICVLLESTEERVPMASTGALQNFLTPYIYLLLGYVERTPGVAPLDWAIRLSEDIERTLAGAFTLGGVAHAVTISPADFDLEVNPTDGIPKIAAFEMRVTARLQQTLAVTP